jgi:predicted NAD-dependent protein-ADP-ribosyltransferase YbiA (DUF1768 family)
VNAASDAVDAASLRWQSVEHYYQAQKFHVPSAGDAATDTARADIIAAISIAPSPSRCGARSVNARRQSNLVNGNRRGCESK